MINKNLSSPQIARDLDHKDLAILKYLQQNGRISNVALSAKVHLSPSPCLERVKRLEELNLLKGYRAQLNKKLLGFGNVTFLQLNLEKMDDLSMQLFRDEVDNCPHIEECHLVAGKFDFILKLRYGLMDDFKEILERIAHFPGVLKTNAHMVIDQIKTSEDLPLDQISVARANVARVICDNRKR